jgi:hypothetical protein
MLMRKDVEKYGVYSLFEKKERKKKKAIEIIVLRATRVIYGISEIP